MQQSGASTPSSDYLGSFLSIKPPPTVPLIDAPPVQTLPQPPLLLPPPLPQLPPPTSPPMAQQHTTISLDGTDYDLNTEPGLAAYLYAANNKMQQQQTTIQTLQTAPALTQQNFNQLITALNPAQHTVGQVKNEVLSTPHNDVMMEEHVVPAGITDIKDVKSPDPFNGFKQDALDFMVCLKAYFVAKPKAMRFTRSRILFACDFLKHPKTAHWAALVRKVIAEGTNNDYYYDNWDNFEKEFLQLYGLTNATQYYFKKLTSYVQDEGQDCKDFTDNFKHLRLAANADKNNAYYLEGATLPAFRLCLFTSDSPPQNYNQFVEQLVKLQNQLDKFKGFGQPRQLFQPCRNIPPMQAPPQQRQQMPKGYGDPMDVDNLKHQKGKQPQRGKAAPTNKFQVKKGAGRLAPHPTASTSRAPPPTVSGPRKPFYCYICDGEGHYARNC